MAKFTTKPNPHKKFWNISNVNQVNKSSSPDFDVILMLFGVGVLCRLLYCLLCILLFKINVSFSGLNTSVAVFSAIDYM